MIKGILQAAFNKPAPGRVQEINEHLLFDLPRLPRSVGLVLGAGVASAPVARWAAGMYRNGYLTELFVTGGLKPVSDPLRVLAFPILERKNFLLPEKNETEADYMVRVLQQYGVPDHAIHIDDQSTNTGQNIENALKLGLGNHNRISAVTLAYHQRRVIGTLRKHLADAVITTRAVYPLDIEKNNWHESFLGRYAVLDETRKMGPCAGQPAYIAKGFAKEVDLEQERERIANSIFPR